MLRRPRRSGSSERGPHEVRALLGRLVELAEFDGDRAKAERRLQIAGLSLAGASVAIALFTWQPWSHASVPRAQARFLPRSHDAILPRSITGVSRPPRPTHPDESLCEAWWRDWLEGERAADRSAATVEVSAPAGIDIAIVGAKVHVYRAYRPQALSYVSCVSGAGPEAGTLLYVDLDHPSSKPKIVADDGSETALTIPNAVINIDPGHTEYVAITPRGSPRMYEWSATLELKVDQRVQYIAVGSSRQPLRSWLGRQPTRQYVYDFGVGAWRPSE